MKKDAFVLFMMPILLTLNFLQSNVVADTSSDKVTIVLHKRVWKDETPEQQVNSGMEMDFKGEPLPGATFDIYEVTKRYYEAETAPSFSVREYMNFWSKKSLNELANEQLGQPIATNITDESGELSVKLPAKMEGKDAVYLFVESDVKAPKGMTVDKVSSAPMLMILPMIDATDHQELSIIHIYPKNVFKTEPIVPSTPDTPVTPMKPFLPQTGQQKSGVAILGFVVILSVVVVVVSRAKKKEKNN